MSSPTTSAASAASSSGLPDGISAPLEAITSSDQGGLIAILGAFALGLVLVSIPIRTYARSKVGPYKMDDYAFIVSSVFDSVLLSYVLKLNPFLGICCTSGFSCIL